ncbi:hypothetical protein ACQEVG_32830 [Streptomyces sp. CA-135486]|uniref:hypothetical protein n=1 Tax=Streptomyces sp. CA-135486 TaxID=3240049 RepID=UPI003D8E4938
MSTAKDARGVDIVEGATCIYGAPVGRSIALVEGVIDGFTASGRVWVKVVRRAYGGSASWGTPRDRVHVGSDRLVVVDALPECVLPTDAEEAAEARKQRVDRYRASIADLEAGGDVPHYLGSRDEALEFYRELLAELEAA